MLPGHVRICEANSKDINTNGEYVLYWMIANRRLGWNFALQRAVRYAEKLEKPLIILEALRVGYQWASDRIHKFVIDGMPEKIERLADSPVAYYPYIESEHGEGSGLLEALAEKACVVVTDEFPCFFLPRMVAAAGKKLPCRLESVDSNGLLPIYSLEKTFPSAYFFRRHLQKELPNYLEELPKPDPIGDATLPKATIPEKILESWPMPSEDLLAGSTEALAQLPIDHEVYPVKGVSGGEAAGKAVLETFLEINLNRYGSERNHPDKEASSNLSPYLHFGFVSVYEAFSLITELEDWDVSKVIGVKSKGQRHGWWGMSESTESFLDELITWREVGYNMSAHNPDYDKYQSLPEWARVSLEEHASDPREYVYTLEELECSRTHDEIWNAAQRQLVQEGIIHNYLRMLWAKKILQWTESPRQALDIMIHLNNKYGLDGRNPNSYSGIFWTLGRFDRPWFERPIFGKIRYMSSESAAKKIKLKNYLEKFGGKEQMKILS